MPGPFQCAFGVPEPEILQQNKDRAELSLLSLYDVIRAQIRTPSFSFAAGEPRTEIFGGSKGPWSRSDRHLDPR